MAKPRIVKDFDKIHEDLIAQIKLNFPRGFEKNLVQFKNLEGKFISALPFETEDFYYLIRMTRLEAQNIVENDEDYDDEGLLKRGAKERLLEDVSEDSEEQE